MISAQILIGNFPKKNYSNIGKTKCNIRGALLEQPNNESNTRRFPIVKRNISILKCRVEQLNTSRVALVGPIRMMSIKVSSNKIFP